MQSKVPNSKRAAILLFTAYATGRKPGERVSDDYYIEPRPARKIPTRDQILASARRQAAYEARTNASPPVIADDYELEEDESYYTTRLPTSARRYQDYQVSPEQVYTSGNTRYHVRYVDVPKRKSRQQLSPPRERYTDEVEALPQAKQHIHPLLYLGVGMLAMAALFLLLSSAASWIQTTKDDLTYGRPRTFNIDAVVGHNDSAANPSHFIAINLYRHVQVIEISGQDSTKERTFQITTLFGDGENLTPVTLSFRDVNGDKKPDMLIHIQDQTLVMINDNGTFRPAKPGEVKGLL
jgi:hypothetical protein